MYRQWVPCERNSSYNFIPIFLKFCTCFLHGLKMCMWFGYNPCINFSYFFHFANFVIFWPQILWKCCDIGYLVSATPHAILYRSFWNFVHVFAMVWRCAYGLDIILELIFVTFSSLWTLSFSDLRFYESLETVGTLWAQLLIQFILIFMKLCTCFCHGLEMCTWLGYNPWINFCHFFHFVNFVIFWPQILWKCIDSGYLVSATPYTTSCLSLCNFAHLFFHGLKMCMWFGFNPAVNCRTCFRMGDLGVQVSVRLSVRQHLPCLVSATPLTGFYRSFWNFADVFFLVWGCACGLDIIVSLFFITFSTLWT